jgi:hypothetical protein
MSRRDGGIFTLLAVVPREIQAFPDVTDDLRMLCVSEGAALNRGPTATF